MATLLLFFIFIFGTKPGRLPKPQDGPVQVRFVSCPVDGPVRLVPVQLVQVRQPCRFSRFVSGSRADSGRFSRFRCRRVWVGKPEAIRRRSYFLMFLQFSAVPVQPCRFSRFIWFQPSRFSRAGSNMPVQDIRVGWMLIYLAVQGRFVS